MTSSADSRDQGNTEVMALLSPATVPNVNQPVTRRTHMKTRLFIIAVAISLASASQGQAQVRSSLLSIYPLPPPPVYVDTVGNVEWSAIASGCFINSTSSASLN